MATVLAVMIFGGALTLAGYAMAATLAPNMARIVAVLRGQPETARFEPLAVLVQAERRIAVRRWAGSTVQGRPVRQREAA
ncbi:hypothetical protein [uncultured Sphingomonas sp.]|uniref:hypothetical protein n=1 Tax=uncultured Sphingomonas sp. TaxID=158754 RepID=UPI0030DD55CA